MENNFIEINPDIRFGKPIIKGTRITIEDVVSMIKAGLTIDEIIMDFPQLNKEQINYIINNYSELIKNQ